MPTVKPYKNYEVLCKATADFFVDTCSEYIGASGRVSIALSGGSTPEGLYKLLATEKYASKIDWNKVFIFWGDERCVPADTKENNSYAATQVLLRHVPIPAENIFPVPVHLPPQEAAKAYEESIKNHFGADTAAFDLILLGMGEDGHTASLFPGTDILNEKNKLVSAVYVEKLKMDRISFTLPLIDQAKQVVFMVSGAGKAAMVEKVLDPQPDTEEVPTMLIHDNDEREVLWLTDEAAVSMLHV